VHARPHARAHAHTHTHTHTQGHREGERERAREREMRRAASLGIASICLLVSRMCSADATHPPEARRALDGETKRGGAGQKDRDPYRH
jgi:hypothetical protein